MDSYGGRSSSVDVYTYSEHRTLKREDYITRLVLAAQNDGSSYSYVYNNEDSSRIRALVFYRTGLFVKF